MNQHDNDTVNLWRLFLILVNSLLVVVILSFVSLLFQDQIVDYLNQPKYTQEELDEITAKRETKITQERSENGDLIENGIHVKTGLKADKNLQIVIKKCTSCHSAKLITQNRATRKGWKNMIVWMQATQGLADLGAQEPKVLDYLAKHYAPQEIGRRKNLDIEAIEWYILDLDEN